LSAHFFEADMTSVTYAYVPHHRQKEFEALGWEYENDLGPPHCVYSSLYRWTGEGEPVYPRFDYRSDDAKNESD